MLGDAFHFMDRPKVPVKHCFKKGYFVALRNAWYIFNPEALAHLNAELAKDGLTEAEIEAKMYYNFAYFRKRVPRLVPPPEEHYRRVRAVFALYGSQVDAKSGRALFNDAAWKKANNVLAEVLEGLAANPPGVQFYYQSLDAKGEPAFDEHRIPLLDCSRGTNDVENSHKQIVTTFGTWCTGVEMSDVLHAERRHRYNHKVSERRRSGFPRLGHFDTWLIDELQLVHEENHGVPLYDSWNNTGDLKDTAEKFGTVRLHSDALDEALNGIDLPPAVTAGFTRDQKYLCKRMGTPAPLLPVHGEEENRLFDELIRVGGFEPTWAIWPSRGAAGSTVSKSSPSSPCTSVLTTQRGCKTNACATLFGRRLQVRRCSGGLMTRHSKRSSPHRLLRRRLRRRLRRQLLWRLRRRLWQLRRRLRTRLRTRLRRWSRWRL